MNAVATSPSPASIFSAVWPGPSRGQRHLAALELHSESCLLTYN